VLSTIDGAKLALVNGPVFIAMPHYNNGLAFWKSDGANDHANTVAQAASHPHVLHAVAIEKNNLLILRIFKMNLFCFEKEKKRACPYPPSYVSFICSQTGIFLFLHSPVFLFF